MMLRSIARSERWRKLRLIEGESCGELPLMMHTRAHESTREHTTVEEGGESAGQ